MKTPEFDLPEDWRQDVGPASSFNPYNMDVEGFLPEDPSAHDNRRPFRVSLGTWMVPDPAASAIYTEANRLAQVALDQTRADTQLGEALAIESGVDDFLG